MEKNSKNSFLSASISGNFGDIGGGFPIYKSVFSGQSLTIRLFNLRLHGNIIFDWVNQPYALKYWNENGTYKPFIDFYARRQLEKPEIYFIMFLNDRAVGFCKVYQAIEDEIAQFIDVGNNDYGIHLLAAPPKTLIEVAGKDAKLLSKKILLLILELLFTVGDVNNVYAEPDVLNIPARRLAERVGFSFIREIEMSYKRASLYCIKNEDFLKNVQSKS